MDRERRNSRGSNSGLSNYLKKPFSWKLGALKLKKSKGTDVSDVPAFDPSTATTFGNENSNFVSFNSELDSAVNQYLSQVTELGYRPTTSGNRLSTFKADWKDKNNSVSSVNSRTSERLLAVQFQLNSNSDTTKVVSKPNKYNQNEDRYNEQEQKIVLDNEDEFSEEERTEVTGTKSKRSSASLDNPLYLSLSECATGADHFYENGNVANGDEPIYENLEGSQEDLVSGREPLYDTVPRRPQVPPKPETLARTLSEENEHNREFSHEDRSSKFSDSGEGSQFTEDVSGDSLSAESLSDSFSQDSSRSSKRRKRKPRDTGEQALLVDGSETSDLGSSGGEDVNSFEEWPSPPPSDLSTPEITGNTTDESLPPPPHPELALQQLEEEVFAEVEREKVFPVADIVTKKVGFHCNDSDDEAYEDHSSSIQAINSSIVEVCRSKDEIAEAKIIDDDEDSSEDKSAVPAIRHSVIIELKDSVASVPKIKSKKDLQRSGSLNTTSLENTSTRRQKSSLKQKNRRLSETGLGVCVGVKHNLKDNKQEFYELNKQEQSDQIIKISEDGSWGMKEKKSVKDSHKKNKTKNSGVRNLKITKMNGTGLYSASCVSLTSAPNSLASTCSEMNSSLDSGDRMELSSPEDINSPTKKKMPFWAAEPNEDDDLDGSDSDLKKRNLGYAIMESYEKELIKKKESLNLPEVSMFDFGGSATDLELDRKNVIKQMIVKTKKKDSWLAGVSATDLNANTSRTPMVPTVKRSNSMSSATKAMKNTLNAKTVSKGLKQSHNNNTNSLLLNLKQSAASKAHVSDDDSEDFVFPSFMGSARETEKNDQNEKVAEIPKPKEKIAELPKPDPLPSIELTIKKLGIDQTTPITPSYIINKNLTSITPFKSSNQKKHSNISSIKANLAASANKTAAVNNAPTHEVVNNNKVHKEVSKSEAQQMEDQANELNSLTTALLEAQERVHEKNLLAAAATAIDKVVDIQNTARSVEEEVEVHLETATTPRDSEVVAAPPLEQEVPTKPANGVHKKKGEVDEASILSAKGATKQYWEDRMMAAAVPAEEGGWEPVGNVCFRDPNAPADSSDEQSEEGSSSAQDIIPAPEFLPAPPPQFDNSPPASIEEPTPSLAVKSQASFPALQNYEDLQKASVEITTKDEKLINLDEEISTLEREVLGEDVEEEEEAEMVELMGEREMEDVSKPNLQYVYGEEGSGPVKKPQQQQVQRRGGEPNRIPTVKGTLTAAQIKENVIEAEIRAQQKRERELQQEQVKKQQLMMNLHNSQKSDDILRKKGASSPQDSDEGFVDPPVERSSTVGGQAADVDTKAGFTHAIPGADGESVIYDAVSPAPVNGHLQRSAPVPATRASVPATTGPKVRSVAPAPAPVASNTTETKIALEIRELKEREEELRKMRDARLAAKRISSHNTTASGAEADDEFVPEEQDMDEDAEDRGSSSSRELLDDHLASLTTTTDEGNFSECGDATSSEDKSSNGSNSRIMSPEVPATEYPRPPRRVTVRPYQDEEEDQPVYTRMKNESVIEREIRMAKERDEAFKKEKGLIMNGAAIKGSNGLTNGKHATLRQSASMSAITTQQNGPRDTQQHMATSRIQLEIAESSQRERELLTVGKVLTLSEDTVDNKVTRLSDLSELPTAQVETQVRTKSPTSSSASTRSISSASGGGSSRQSPNASPHSTLTSTGRLPQQNGHHTINGHLTNGFSNGLSNGHHFNSLTNGGSARLTRSLSTTNLSSPSSLTTVNGGGGAGLRPPKGFMEKFIASRGKMTPSAFSSPPPMGGGSGRVVATRPMRVQPKAPVVLRQQATDNTPTKDDEAGKLSTASVTSSTAATVAETKVNGVVKSEQKSEGKSPTPQAPYKRFIGAEEKIQEELRDMQQREEELRQLRSRNMARSQPNLLEMGLSEISFEEEPQNGIEEEHGEEEVETGIRSAVSNPNLLEDGPDAKTLKNLRRRSTLIAEWENRIQATTVADA